MSQAAPEFPKIPLATAVAIVIANMVGTGVFTSLGFQVGDIPAGFPIVVLWIVGGLLAFCGAVCYAELAAMMPRSGGEYHLLSQTYHPMVGFLSGWISVTVGFSAPIAAAALAFGSYFSEALQGGFRLSPRALALIVVLVVSAIHLTGIRSASRFQVAFTLGKVLLLIFLVGAAFIAGDYQGLSFSPFAPVEIGGNEAMSWQFMLTPGFAIALYWVSYSYTGWNAAAYVVGEMDRPKRNIPLALLIGTGVVTVLYVGINTAFLYSTPIEAMAYQKEVAYEAANYIFSRNGATVVGLLICFGLISTISSMVWAGPRITQVMGEDYRLFSFLSKRSASGSPRLAILVQLAIVVFMVLLFDFEQIILYIQAILIFSSAAVVFGVFYLRIRKPKAERPYKAWGYPVTPALFIYMSGYMLIFFVQQKPKETLLGLLTLVVGAGVYFLSLHLEKKGSDSR